VGASDVDVQAFSTVLLGGSPYDWVDLLDSRTVGIVVHWPQMCHRFDALYYLVHFGSHRMWITRSQWDSLQHAAAKRDAVEPGMTRMDRLMVCSGFNIVSVDDCHGGARALHPCMTDAVAMLRDRRAPDVVYEM
jgi:hypothetical protein